MIGTPEQPFPVQLPSGGLYTIKPGSGSPYLVETDPRFASYGGFLGSDYLLGRLGLGGDLTLKRLGDAFYETQLVMDQITSLTGRRYLSGEDDALDQYKALMDAGAQEAQSFHLTVGIALTPDQVASLTQDMVWLVSEQVNGESVLVPVVYLSQKTAESVASGAVIQGTTVNLNASRQLISTGTIQASQDASIKAGHLLNAGNLSAGGSLSVQAAQDLLNAGTIQGGNVALVAGNDLVSGTNAGGIHLGDVKLDSLNVPNLNLPATGSITAIGDLTAQAGHNLTLDHATLSAGDHLGLAAANDLTATASTLNAGGSAQLIAGNNLGLNASAGQRSGEQTDHSATATMHADVTTLKAGGNVVLAAGNDLTSQGAQLQAGDQLALSAGHDISLNAVTDTQSQGNSWRNGSTQYNQYAYDEHLRGTVIDGANGVALSAGHDVTTVAANVTSANGGIVIAAGNDIHLHAGQENHTWQQDSTSKTSGFLSSTTKTTHDAAQDSLAVGTLLSGSAVTVAAGRDITAQAAQIVATDDVVMAAGNNLELGTATSTHSEQHDRTTKTSGMFTSGLNLMIGSSKESQSYSETDTTPQGSVIGSLNGGVTLTAGNLVHITGSDVLSQTGTAIVGKDVTIDAAVGTQDTTQTYKQQQAGLTLGLGGAVANAVSSAYASAERGSQVSDDRLKALYAAQAAYSASDALGFAQGGLLNGATKDNPTSQQGVTLQLGIGGSSASSTTTTHDETAYGSYLRSAGDITIAATGGDLNIIGSQVDGRNVALAAANNLNFLSQQENHTLQSNNKNASGGVGIQIGSDGVGFYAQASVGKGSAHGNGTTHVISTINANDTLTLVSGSDTTIKGAQLTGNTVLGAIGGNLLIQSEQDTDDYASKQQQLGAKAVIGYGSSASVSYNQSKVNSHYQSVNEVSGIQAGSGGFDIAVGGNTHLVGGAISSTADPSKNLLDTGSLTYESIRNEANYSASSVGVSASYGGGSFSASPSLGVPQGGHSSSETASGIAQGTINIRDGHVDLAGLDRNPTLDHQALSPIFDAQKVQEKMEMGQVAGQVGMRAAGDLAGQMGWAEGSPERTVLHGVVGAGIAALGGGNVVQGALGAAANQFVIQKMADYLESQGYTPGTPEFASMLQLASTAVGAAVGGGAGAATALDGTTYNYLTHQQLTDLQKEIYQCRGDRVCIESAKSNAEISSAKQEKELIVGCNAAYVDCAKNYAGNISNAIDYINDPLAAQLGLQVDQSITAQNYLSYRSQWGLVYADNAASQNGQLMFAPAVAGAGTAAAVAAAPATLAWGKEAWAAYQAATQGYSLTAGIGTGAVASGITYTGSAALGAFGDSRSTEVGFGAAFDRRFSFAGLGGTMLIGAMGGAYQTSMFQAANVANTWKNIFVIEGAVIRGNQILMTMPAKKAVQAATQESTGAHNAHAPTTTK
jgi:filamentous hemagglutinin